MRGTTSGSSGGRSAGYFLGQQLSANRVLRGHPALGVAHGNVLRHGLPVARVVRGVGRDDLSVLREGRVDFANEFVLVVESLHHSFF